MSGWLLDTNVLSELRRPRPDARVLSFIASQRLEDLFVSTVTFAEIRFGIEAVADAVRRAELNEWLGHRVRPMFEQRVLEVSEDIMLTWRLLVEEGRKVGHTFSQPDLIIAATALQHGLTVVTRDTGDYARSRASPPSSAARRCGPRAGSRCARIRRRTWWTTSSPRAGAAMGAVAAHPAAHIAGRTARAGHADAAGVVQRVIARHLLDAAGLMRSHSAPTPMCRHRRLQPAPRSATRCGATGRRWPA